MNALKTVLTLLLLPLASLMFAQDILTLDQAVDEALSRNFDIRISRTGAESAKANNTAGNAGMLPTVSLGAQAVAKNTDSRTENTTGSLVRSSQSGLALNESLALNWTLYDGGKMFVTRERLRQLQAQGDLQFRQTVQQTLYEVVAAYYDLIRLKQQYKALEQTQRYNEERLLIATTGLRAGSLSRPDFLQVQMDKNEVTASFLTQKAGIQKAKRSLNTLLARDPDRPFEVGDSIPETALPDAGQLAQQLLVSNPALLAFQKQVEINQLAYKATFSNYLPRLDFSAAYNMGQSDNSQMTNAWADYNRGPQITGSLSIPIYKAGENKRLRKQAALTLQSSEAELEQLRLQLQQTLRNAWTDYENQQALVRTEAENCLLAKEYLEICIVRFRQGTTTSLEVQLAQQKYLEANARLINDRYALKLAETSLRQLTAAL